VLLACPREACGRRVAVKQSGELVVLQQGDFYASHVGGRGPIDVAASMGQ
jgi:hypothetical protein